MTSRVGRVSPYVRRSFSSFLVWLTFVLPAAAGDALASPSESAVAPLAAGSPHSGDVNGDGVITAGDWLLVENQLLGKRYLGQSQIAAADTNGDGAIDVADLVGVHLIFKNSCKRFKKTFGGSADDTASGGQQTLDGGYVIAGGTASFGAGAGDAWLIKTDAGGNKEWDRTFGGTADDGASAIQQTSDGGYAIAGYTNSYGPRQPAAWLIKTDAAGNKEWDQTFASSIWATASSVQQTADGGYVIAGTAKGSQGAYDYNYVIIKTDAAGNKQWEHAYDKGYGLSSGSYDLAHSVRQTSDGGYMVVGEAGAPSPFDFGDAWLVKTDSDGNTQWKMAFGGKYGDAASSVQQTLDGGYAIAGQTDWDGWLIKTDAAGTKEWDRTFGGKEMDSAYSVLQTSDGGYIFAGEAKSYSVGGNDFDAWLVKTDDKGIEKWNRTFGGAGRDQGNSVRQAADGGYVIVGATKSYGAGGDDVWLIKTDDEGLAE